MSLNGSMPRRALRRLGYPPEQLEESSAPVAPVGRRRSTSDYNASQLQTEDLLCLTKELEYIGVFGVCLMFMYVYVILYCYTVTFLLQGCVVGLVGFIGPKR